MLISIKMLVLQRAKMIGHEALAEKFDLKTLRAIGIFAFYMLNFFCLYYLAIISLFRMSIWTLYLSVCLACIIVPSLCCFICIEWILKFLACCMYVGFALMEHLKGQLRASDVPDQSQSAALNGCNLLDCSLEKILSIDEIMASVCSDRRKKPGKRLVKTTSGCCCIVTLFLEK